MLAMFDNIQRRMIRLRVAPALFRKLLLVLKDVSTTRSIVFSISNIDKHCLHVWGSLADCSLLSLSPSGSRCPVLRGCGLDVYYGRQFP